MQVFKWQLSSVQGTLPQLHLFVSILLMSIANLLRVCSGFSHQEAVDVSPPVLGWEYPTSRFLDTHALCGMEFRIICGLLVLKGGV